MLVVPTSPTRQAAAPPLGVEACSLAGAASPAWAVGGPQREAVLPVERGPYQLFDTVGRGGMADLYVARDRTGGARDRLVVIKEVRHAHEAERRLEQLLLREAALIARLSHPNVVRVRHWHGDDRGAYAVLEYVEGLDLREALRIAAGRGMWIPLPLALYVIRSVLCGLAHVHRRRDGDGAPLSIVHRDVSPANVLLGFEGQVKLCDFGIATCLGEDPGEGPCVEGKAGYMSPEQARGLSVDVRSDLFAVGIMLWELCSARRMYRATADQALIEVAQQATVPSLATSHLPQGEALRAIVERALEADPAKRYPSAHAFLEDLRKYVSLADLDAGARDLGRWLRTTFGQEPDILRRRARERALQGLECGPAVTLQPLSSGVAAKLGRKTRWPAGVRTFLLHALAAGALTFGLLWTLV